MFLPRLRSLHPAALPRVSLKEKEELGGGGGRWSSQGGSGSCPRRGRGSSSAPPSRSRRRDPRRGAHGACAEPPVQHPAKRPQARGARNVRRSPGPAPRQAAPRTGRTECAQIPRSSTQPSGPRRGAGCTVRPRRLGPGTGGAAPARRGAHGACAEAPVLGPVERPPARGARSVRGAPARPGALTEAAPAERAVAAVQDGAELAQQHGRQVEEERVRRELAAGPAAARRCRPGHSSAAGEQGPVEEGGEARPLRARGGQLHNRGNSASTTAARPAGPRDAERAPRVPAAAGRAPRPLPGVWLLRMWDVPEETEPRASCSKTRRAELWGVRHPRSVPAGAVSWRGWIGDLSSLLCKVDFVFSVRKARHVH